MRPDPMVDVRQRLAAAARRFAESGAEPVTPRPAATVALLRPPLEVFLLRRTRTMAFAAGMHVFPGGAVDPRDAAADLPFAGPTPAEWGARLGLPEAVARAVVCAAAREVFEEAGVLLAAPVGADPSASAAPPVVGGPAIGGLDVSTPAWEAHRDAVERRELGFAELLVREGLELRTDLLRPWARWITPEFEPRRYDTWFFVAALPTGQTSRHATGEADEARWVPVADTTSLLMLPPTRTTLDELAALASLPAVLAAGEHRDAAEPVRPTFDLPAPGG
jgi:8-oxo-dGTP pyrophosphatase MutT (NUDIX family)